MKNLILIFAMCSFPLISFSQDQKETKTPGEKALSKSLKLKKGLGLTDEQTKKIEKAFLVKIKVFAKNNPLKTETKNMLTDAKQEKSLLKMGIADLKQNDPNSTALRDQQGRMQKLNYHIKDLSKEINELNEENRIASSDFQEELESILTEEQEIKYQEIKSSNKKGRGKK